MSTASQRIEEERRAKFCGTASIRLDAIRYNTSFSKRIGVQESTSVASLKILFREELESCQAGGKYRAKVLIRQEDLEKALNRSEISIASLIASSFPHPKLEIPSTTTLECLQGHDRLAAAEEVLEGSQKRWDVDLFLDDLSVELKESLWKISSTRKSPVTESSTVKFANIKESKAKRTPFSKSFGGADSQFRRFGRTSKNLITTEDIPNPSILCCKFQHYLM
ncbi:hypothetical protein MY4038_009646, partial [Beauveria bassiana]